MIRTLQLYPDDASELVPFSQQAEPENRPILEERSLATPMNGRVRFFKNSLLEEKSMSVTIIPDLMIPLHAHIYFIYIISKKI